MTSYRYPQPRVDPRWCDVRETHRAVGAAIHAIANAHRTPDAIWEQPTALEEARVRRAVAQYIRDGAFVAEEDSCYPWGQSCLQL